MTRMVNSTPIVIGLIPIKLQLGSITLTAEEERFLNQTNNGQDERNGLPSASSFYRYQLCPGSWQMEQRAHELGVVAHETSAVAQRGEKIHAFLAGEPISLEPKDRELAEFLRERALAQLERIFGSEKLSFLIEKRLWLKVGERRPVLSGRFDQVYFTDKIALVQDFKSGWSEPEPAEQNAQMMVLAVLVGLSLPDLEEIIVQVISRSHGVSEARYGVRELETAYNQIHSVLTRLGKADAPLVPSVEACRYCPAILICPAIQEAIKPMTKKLVIEELPRQGPKATELLDRAGIVKNYIAELEKFYAKIVSDAPGSVPEYQMAPGPGKRAVSDWEAASARLGEYLEPHIVKEAQSFKMTQLEAALGDSLGLSLKEAKLKFNQILEGLIEIKYPAPSLRRSSIAKPRLSAED
jgi:uncharacterized protein DUF2800